MKETAPPENRFIKNPFQRLKNFIHDPLETPFKQKSRVSRRHFFVAAAGIGGTIFLSSHREVSADSPASLLSFGDEDTQKTAASLDKRTAELEREIKMVPKELPKTRESIYTEIEEAMSLPLGDHRRWVIERRAVLATFALIKKGPWDLDPETKKPKGLALAETLTITLTNQYARDGALEIIWAYRQTGLIKDLKQLNENKIDWAKDPQVTTVYNGRETIFRTDPRMLACCHDARSVIREILKDSLRKEHPEYADASIELLVERKTPDVGTLIGVMTLETTYDLYYDGRRQALANIGDNLALARIKENNPKNLGDYQNFVERLTRQTGFPFDKAEIPSSNMGAIGPQMLIYNLERLRWESDYQKGIPEPNPFHPLGAVIYIGLFLAEAGYDSSNPSTIKDAVGTWNHNKPDEAEAILAIRTSYVRNIEQTGSSSRGGIEEVVGPDSIY